MARRHHPSLCRLLALALLSTPALGQGAPQDSATSSAASILFSRTQYGEGNQIRSTSIFRTDPQGLRVTQLTPWISGYQFKPGSWSPNGSSIVYELVRDDRPSGQSQLYVMDRQGGGVRRITRGLGMHSMPAWGPGGIAYAQGSCLALVRGNGEGQHVLFCPPEDHLLRPPQWTTDGQSVLIQAGHRAGPAGPVYQTLWRVAAGSGQATLLFRFEDDEQSQQPHFSFSPTRQEGLFWGGGGPVARATFRNGYLWSFNAQGYWYRYTADGNRIAFGGVTLLPDGAAYANLYVAERLVGDDVRQLTSNYSHLDVDWVAVQWSRDASCVLAIKRTLNSQRELPPLRQELRIVNVATGRQIRLPEGEAIEGAWFQP